MITNGDAQEDITTLFSQIGDLEKQFADVELDALRRKEFDLKDLYIQRAQLLSQVPSFWTDVFLNAPEEIQPHYSQADLPILSAIKSFSVERYQIKSHTEGEPRSLRFTFEFAENEHFHDTTLVKDFAYRPSPDGDGPGNLVSKAVPIEWKSKKEDLTRGLLDMAVELEAAEEKMRVKKGGFELDLVEREGLWQYEKLRERLEKEAEEEEEGTGLEGSFMRWFGFRGAVGGRSVKEVNGGKVENGEGEGEEDSDDEDDGMLDVEIFTAGEEVAIALEDMWPDAVDFFMRAQEDPTDLDDFEGFEGSDDDVEDEEDEAPQLVADEEIEAKDERPRKKQRTG